MTTKRREKQKEKGRKLTQKTANLRFLITVSAICNRAVSCQGRAVSTLAKLYIFTTERRK